MDETKSTSPLFFGEAGKTDPTPISARDGVASNHTRVKGVAFRSVITSLGKLRGAPIKSAAIQGMGEELQRGFSYGGIVAGGWYPVALYREMFQAIRQTTGEGNELIFDIGRQCLQDDLTGIYRALAKLVGPQTLFSFVQRLFSSYYSAGKVEVIESRAGFSHARWSGCVGFDESMWTELLGSSVEVLTIGGARHVRGRIVAGGKDGDDMMEGTAHWS